MRSKPRPFLWGAATSSHQIEGGNEHNDWWAWEAEGHIEGGVRSGDATDHWNRFREDLQLAASLGLNSYRFSIEWSRLEPEEGLWNTAALDRYREILSECERLGLLPMLTLHHFTSPRWFAEKGGFTQSRAAEKFAAYVSRVIEAFGLRIPLWCTINEPMVLVAGSYLGTFMPPGRWAPRLASQASHQLLKAHVLAYDLLHSQSRERKGPWKEGRVLDCDLLPLELILISRRCVQYPPVYSCQHSPVGKRYTRSMLDSLTRFPAYGPLRRPGTVPLRASGLDSSAP